MTPSVLLGIVTHNRAGLLPKAIQSALAQLSCKVQVAVIDDASTDLAPRLPGAFPMVTWNRWATNRGYMSARNLWMSSEFHEYFVSLDDDAWFLDGDEIASAIEVLEHNPRIAALAFDILSPDRPDRVPRSSPRPTASFIGCGHVLRLSAIRSVGVYEPTPGTYGGEEKDLCLRLLDAGYDIFHMPGVHVWHDKTSIARALPSQHRSGVCNDLVMSVRRTPAWLLPFVLVSKCYKHWRFSHRNDLSRPCLEGFALFGRSLLSVWRSRRPVSIGAIARYRRLTQTGE